MNLNVSQGEAVLRLRREFGCHLLIEMAGAAISILRLAELALILGVFGPQIVGTPGQLPGQWGRPVGHRSRERARGTQLVGLCLERRPVKLELALGRFQLLLPTLSLGARAVLLFMQPALGFLQSALLLTLRLPSCLQVLFQGGQAAYVIG